MRTLTEILAGLAILANAVIYGTDVFGAIVLRPAIAAVDDRTLTQLLGHVHRIADRRHSDGRARRRDRAVGECRGRGPRHPRPDHLPGDLHPDQQACEHSADRSGSRQPSARRRSSAPIPLRLGHRRARRAPDPRTRRTVHRTRRSLTQMHSPAMDWSTGSTAVPACWDVSLIVESARRP